MNFSLIINYLVIVIFVIMALVLISVFMDKGPKQWALLIGAIGAGILALFWTRQRHLYTEKKLKQHNEKIKALLDTVQERDNLIKQNNQKITELMNERNSLLNSAKVDQERLQQIDESIEQSKRVHETINRTIDTQEQELASALEEHDQHQDLPSTQQILQKYGISSSRLPAQAQVADPNPSGRDTDIVVNGFTMKGDQA